jgi:hypothetical protein
MHSCVAPVEACEIGFKIVECSLLVYIYNLLLDHHQWLYSPCKTLA